MKRVLLFLFGVVLALQGLQAQQRVSGQVTDTDGAGLEGVAVIVRGTTAGTFTGEDGKFSVEVPSGATTLEFRYVGKETVTQAITGSVVNVMMSSNDVTLDEVVVTALGIARDKKSLGYATQEVGGDEVTRVKDVNFINALSGKIAGVTVSRSNQIGGSSNVIVRGYASLTGNNQALFVVDGIIMSNNIDNSTNMQTGRGGFDYGNAAMDINPDDIESINVLKGAAATALYGSRAANGVIVITTKKGRKGQGLGVSASFGTTFGSIDPSTFVRYQKEYGPGYSTYQGWYPEDRGFEYYDFGNGPELATAMYEDASYGPAFDPSIMVYDWRSVYPELASFGQKFPYTAAANDASTFYETSRMLNTNVSVDGGTDRANYRLSFTNTDQKGILPNSRIVRNTVSFSGGYDLTERLKVSSTVNYVLTEGLGRYGTGYDNRNPNQSFRQWYQVTTDMVEQREAYEATGLNLSWNPYGSLDPGRATVPHYFDNYYFNRYENYNNDERNRMFGNVQVDYQLTDWLSFMGRMSTDRYSELREERIAVGSVDVSSYARTNRSFYENNLDLILSAEKYFGDLSVSGMLGANYRRTGEEAISAATNGGLVTPGVYALSNSVNNPEAPGETAYTIGADGYFARANFGYADMLYLDLTGRYDIASTLPAGNNTFFYPSASLSFVFSELLPISDRFNLGKVRFNYAEVGNLAPALLVNDIYILNTPFNGVPLSTASSIRRNPNLVSENTRSLEAGLELNFFQNRLGLDMSVYSAQSFNQIYRAEVTAATGRRTDVVNAGEIDNKGIEVVLRAVPIATRDFKWKINLNWAANRNEVVDLFGDQTNLQLTSVQGGITLNATEGQPYGAIWGTNYVFHTDGNPIVYPHFASGVRFRKTGSPEVIGDINPDWRGGIMNTLTYKGLTFSFLVDMQMGGNFFSLDTWYGYATGIYDITAGTNAEGGRRRDLPSEGGGLYLSELPYAADMTPVMQATDENGTLQFDAEGNPISDGTLSTEAFYVSDVYNSLGYVYAPNAFHVYDASFVKLREVSLNYSLPASIVSKTPLKGVDLSLIGRNLWIIHKNAPYTDPESGLSAGNVQGYQSGAYPAVREYGFNIGLRF